jgi:hypothetical protein
MEHLIANEKTIASVSLRELEDKLGISLNAIARHMGILEKQGKISRNGVARHIEILQKPTKPPTKNKALAAHVLVLNIRDTAKDILKCHEKRGGRSKAWDVTSGVVRDELLDKLAQLFVEYEAMK